MKGKNEWRLMVCAVFLGGAYMIRLHFGDKDTNILFYPQIFRLKVQKNIAEQTSFEFNQL